MDQGTLALRPEADDRRSPLGGSGLFWVSGPDLLGEVRCTAATAVRRWR